MRHSPNQTDARRNQTEDMTPVAEQLIDAENSRVTLTIDGEEYSGYLDNVDYAPYIPDAQWPEEGEIDAVFELDSEEVERHGLDSVGVDIRATEERPGKWTDPNAAVWSPEIEDGRMVDEEWITLGTVEAVEKTPEGA